MPTALWLHVGPNGQFGTSRSGAALYNLHKPMPMRKRPHCLCVRSIEKGCNVAFGSNSTELAEATHPFMSAIPLIPTVNSVRRCGSWRIVPYLALDRARCLSTAVVKLSTLSTCQDVKLNLDQLQLAALARFPPALLFRSERTRGPIRPPLGSDDVRSLPMSSLPRRVQRCRSQSGDRAEMQGLSIS